MCSTEAGSESSRSPRRLNAVAVVLAALLAAALFSGTFDGGFPTTPARAEAVAPAAARLCFQGRGGELLDFAAAGRCR